MLAMEPRAPRTIKSVEVICITSPENEFPARAIHTPPFRSRGMTGNRLFNRTPSTKEEGMPKTPETRRGRWVPQATL